MRRIGNFLVLLLVIAAISAGIYVWMDERDEGPFEEAGEKVDQAIEDLADGPDEKN